MLGDVEGLCVLVSTFLGQIKVIVGNAFVEDLACPGTLLKTGSVEIEISHNNKVKCGSSLVY